MTKAEAGTNGFVKRGWLYLVVTVAVVTNGLQLMFGFVDVSNFKNDVREDIEVVEERVDTNTSRIITLEAGQLSNREILIELQINLKNHVISSGEVYVERDK